MSNDNYTKIRAALLAFVGVEDTLPALTEFRKIMLQMPGEDDNKYLCVQALDALIETHPEHVA